ncbi:MAG: fasciclin domain-containing protein, partial [Bacteroidota bacterium]
TLVATLGGIDGDGDGTNGELVGILQGAGPFTVFAPINQAFTDIEGTTATLSDAQISTVLTYHVASGNVLSSTLTDGQAVSTVAQEDFTINIDAGVVTATDATGGVSTITATDVQGTNGVIHVLDRVLIPTL